MYEEVTEIELLGLVHSAEEWLTFALNLNKQGESAFSAMVLRAIYEWAKENDNTQLQSDCRMLMTTINIPHASTFVYQKGGATDPHNRQNRIWKRAPDIDIFDFRLDEGKIIESIQTIDFKELEDRWYWFVFHRVFDELRWLSVKRPSKFADWVNLYFHWTWERTKPWRTVPKEIRDSHSWEWGGNTVPGNDVGKHFAALARLLWATFTDKPKLNEDEVPDDKDYFYLPNKTKINNGQPQKHT